MSQQNPSLIYLEQTLTAEQKAQVLTNIGAQAAESGKGLVPNTDIEKLASIAADAEENTIETISVGGGEALPVDEYKNVNIPLASPSAEAHDDVPAVAGNPGAMSANDKAKLNSIEQGAQVNVKPDWNAESGSSAEILNKPSIPTVNNSTISMKIEDDSTPFDSFSTNAASGKTIEIPLATAPAGASEGNSGAVTASDKYKLNNLTKTHIHMLKAVSDYGLPSTEEAPYGFWVLDMEKPNADAPNNYGYDYATPADLIAGIRAGNIYGLYTDPTSPEIPRNQDADLFIMGRVQNQESSVGALDGIRIWFYKLFVGDNPLKMRVTTIYASHGRMALLPYNPATSTSAQNEYTLSTRGVPSADSGDAGKFLGVDSNGDCTWQLVEHVPGVTSSDNGKVLTASYDSTTQTGSAGWASGTTRKVHRIYYDEDSAQTGDTFGVLQDLEGTFDTTNHCYPQVLADDFYDWLVEGQYIVLIIGNLGSLSSPPTPEDYYYGDFLHPNFIDYGIDQYDEKWVEIRFHQIDSSNPSIRWTFVDTTSQETPNYARISLDEDLIPYEQFPVQYDLSAPLTSGDAGKVLRAGWHSGNPSYGIVDWDDAREVPTVGSTDNGKVLKATYNSSTGEGSYAWDSASGEANVIEGVKLAGAASVLTPDASKNVTIPNAVATGETGATNGLMTAADKKTVSESVIYKANPTSGAEHLLAQRLYIVRSDQEIINIITGGGAEGQGTILFRIG
jgi:hypothetical protein